MIQMARRESVYSCGLLFTQENDPNGSRISPDLFTFRTEVKARGGV